METTGIALARTAGKITGPGASAIKYDILTALLAMAAQGEPVEARLALRLTLLVTARYNWRAGTFAVGQREMAQMWGVTERTAKREVAAMRGLGWIVVANPAARGRVAQYRIVLETVLRQTMPFWGGIGSDFVARMTKAPEPEGQGATNVIPLRRDDSPLPVDDGTCWSAVAARLQSQDPAVYGAWFAGLTAIDIESGVLTLAAPTRFIADYVRSHYQARLLATVATEDRSIREVSILCLAP